MQLNLPSLIAQLNIIKLNSPNNKDLSQAINSCLNKLSVIDQHIRSNPDRKSNDIIDELRNDVFKQLTPFLEQSFINLSIRDNDTLISVQQIIHQTLIALAWHLPRNEVDPATLDAVMHSGHIPLANGTVQSIDSLFAFNSIREFNHKFDGIINGTNKICLRIIDPLTRLPIHPLDYRLLAMLATSDQTNKFQTYQDLLTIKILGANSASQQPAAAHHTADTNVTTQQIATQTLISSRPNMLLQFFQRPIVKRTILLGAFTLIMYTAYLFQQKFYKLLLAQAWVKSPPQCYGKSVNAYKRFCDPLPANVIQQAHLESVLQTIIPALIGIWFFNKIDNKLAPDLSI